MLRRLFIQKKLVGLLFKNISIAFENKYSILICFDKIRVLVVPVFFFSKAPCYEYNIFFQIIFENNMIHDIIKNYLFSDMKSEKLKIDIVFRMSFRSSK